MSFCPYPGGVSTFQAYNLAYLDGKGALSLVDEHPENTLASLQGSAQRRVEVLRVPLWSAKGRAASALWAWLQAYQPTILWLSHPGVLVRYWTVLQKVRRILGARVGLTQHSGTLQMTPRRAALEVLTAVAMCTLDDLVYVSASTQHYWNRRYPWTSRLRSRILPNGVPIPDANPRNPPETMRVGFVGRAWAEKGPDLFCQVAELAHRHAEKMEFHFFGMGPLETNLRRQYARCVSFHGHVSDIGRIFSGVDILLITSQVENCSYALLEAKSYGVPVVAPRVGGLPEIIAEGRDGILTGERTKEALLAALRRARGSYSLLSAGCLETRRRFDIQVIGRTMWKRHVPHDTACEISPSCSGSVP